MDHARREYASLLSVCDASLGRVLDAMDELALWDVTLLIVCTDHGLLLGEHGWWGKNVQPWYDETIHTPLFIWDPRSRVQDERRASLVQTIDLAPTLLDHFGLTPTPDMQGRPLRRTVADDTPVRKAGLFGAFGGHVSVTDGRHVYMRACAEPANQPLHEHTLMPTHMRGRFTPAELKKRRVGAAVLLHQGGAAGEGAGPRHVQPVCLRDLALRPGDRRRSATPSCRRHVGAAHGDAAHRPAEGVGRPSGAIRPPGSAGVGPGHRGASARPDATPPGGGAHRAPAPSGGLPHRPAQRPRSAARPARAHRGRAHPAYALCGTPGRPVRAHGRGVVPAPDRRVRGGPHPPRPARAIATELGAVDA
ncbi:sulfatase-like hydrolase/transferase [Streptomyces sp. NPDC048428]|uniref:sulfatase-like hydrolase/transferase n=1 Tax=Streptomyces sp. NPDC048428 TaxID=3154503 RepID=UPI00342772D1